jgi:hypothetical protein
MSDGFYRFSGAIWGGFLRFCSTFAWPLGIGGGIAIGALLVVMYWGGAFTPKKNIETIRQETIQKFSETEREYLAAIIYRDAIASGEPIRVQEGVGWAAINYRRVNGVDISTIFGKGLTMVPLGYMRKHAYWASLTYIKKWEASTGDWTAALNRADALITKGKAAVSDPTLLCATHYIRKVRGTHREEPEALAGLTNGSMAEVPKGTGPNPGDARFFCPK